MERTVRRGIHRGYKSEANQEPRRAWVADAPGATGEWVSETEYRAAGYSPDFDSLPVRVVVASAAIPIEIDDLPEVDREFVRGCVEGS